MLYEVITALKSEGKSLLPIGVTNVHGVFERGDVVSCIDQTGQEIARGIVNYNTQETMLIV